MNQGQPSGPRLPALDEAGRRGLPPGRRLALALLPAAALHGGLILGFELAWRQDAPQPAPALEIALHFPPAPPGPSVQSGPAPTSAAPAIRAPNAPSPAELPSFQEAAPTPAEPQPLGDSEAPGQSWPAPFKRSYDALIREIAAAQRDADQSQLAKVMGPRTRRLANAAGASLAEAAYLNAWRQKVERIGRANHPGGSLQGQLRMLVVIRYDGALLKVRILQSSGHSVLDEAALRIVRLAAPYAQFPVDMRKAYDQLEITRTWQFSRAAARLNA